MTHIILLYFFGVDSNNCGSCWYDLILVVLPRFFHGRYIDKESISDVEVMLIQAECILKKALKINKISRLETTTAHVQPALGRSTFKETLVLAEECTVHSRRHSRKSNLWQELDRCFWNAESTKGMSSPSPLV